MDTEAIQAAYEDVRSDATTTNWVVLKYDGATIVVSSVGTEFDEFRGNFTVDERAFGFLRLLTGDEMSKRSKFVLITWSGSEVSPIKRAKVSTDKPLIKQVLKSVSVEVQTSELEDVDEDSLMAAVNKASGANYGTGERD